MSYFLLPLNGLIPLVQLVATGFTLTALLDVAVHPSTGFRSFGKLPKWAWVVTLTVGLAVPLLGVVTAIAYFAGVRRWVEFARSLNHGDPSDPEGETYIRC